MRKHHKKLQMIYLGTLFFFGLLMLQPEKEISAGTKVKLSKSSYQMYCGMTNRIRVRNVKKKSRCKYKSKNKRVVRVSANGVLCAIRPGAARVTVHYPGMKSAVCKIKVGQYIKSLKVVSANTILLKEGDSSQMRAFVLPSNALNTNTNFQSRDKSVVRIDSKGRLNALKEGTTQITVTSVGMTKKKKKLKQVITVVVQKKLSAVHDPFIPLNPQLPLPDAVPDSRMVAWSGLCKDKDGRLYTVYMLNKSYRGVVSICFNGKSWETKRSVSEIFFFLEYTLAFKYTSSDGSIQVEKKGSSNVWDVTELGSGNVYSIQGFMKDMFFHSSYGIVLVKGDTIGLVEFK